MDCIDFDLSAHSWILNKFWDHPVLVEANGGQMKNDIIDALINLPFWMSDEGYFGPMQFWSENHQIGWKAAQYLIGHAFASNPELQDLVFVPSGLTGEEMKSIGKDRVLEWLDYRIRFGFSEFNSDTYGPIAYEAVLTLSGLSPDEDVRIMSQGVQMLMEFDHILASRGDRISTARGRAYTEGKIDNNHYKHLYMLKDQGDEQDAYFEGRTIYFVLNMMHGVTYPTTLLEIGQSVETTAALELIERFAIGTDEGPAEGEL